MHNKTKESHSKYWTSGNGIKDKLSKFILYFARKIPLMDDDCL